MILNLCKVSTGPGWLNSIGPYFVDFYCPSEKLIIEPDGNPHGEYYKFNNDTKRDEYLHNLGLTILRFENRFAFQEPDRVMKEISDVFNQPPRPGNNKFSDKQIESRPPLLEK